MDIIQGLNFQERSYRRAHLKVVQSKGVWFARVLVSVFPKRIFQVTLLDWVFVQGS